MKRIVLILILCVFTLQTFGQNYTGRNPKIDNNVVSQLRTLYLKEKYKECIDSCKYYIGYRYYDLGYESHPCEEFNRHRFFYENKIEDIAYVLYFGTISAYQYSLTNFDTESIFDGMTWARICANICKDYLSERTPTDFWSVDEIDKYYRCGQMGKEVAECGIHFLHIDNDKWAKKESKWFEKTSDKIYETLAKKLSGFETKYPEYPLLQYQITDICTARSIRKDLYKEYKDIFNRRFTALINLIENNQNNIYDAGIHIALKSLTSMLTGTVIENEICKKIGDNYERFCMENLIKLQDISYSISGSSRYSDHPAYTLEDIQKNLKESDCAIIHFEAPVASGRLYFQQDLGTIYRNYALIITRDQIVPDVWHRGYIKDDVVNDLSVIRKKYPNAQRFFYVGTPRMSFIDIAGTDSAIVRLHSLSQLLDDRSSEVEISEVTFIGDINYDKIGKINTASINKGGDFGPLIGPAIELKQLMELNRWNLRPIRGDDATRSVVASEISRSKSIVHISTHGELFDYDDNLSPDDLALQKDVMDNSRLILSGYNRAPESPLSSISGSDVMKIKKIETPIVFLDACSSGRGSFGVSGSVGIAEAFHMIGARNIICYLEPVEDEVATRFSELFYKELAKGVSCHDAFFRAKNLINSQIKIVLWE